MFHIKKRKASIALFAIRDHEDALGSGLYGFSLIIFNKVWFIIPKEKIYDLSLKFNK